MIFTTSLHSGNACTSRIIRPSLGFQGSNHPFKWVERERRAHESSISRWCLFARFRSEKLHGLVGSLKLWGKNHTSNKQLPNVGALRNMFGKGPCKSGRWTPQIWHKWNCICIHTNYLNHCTQMNHHFNHQSIHCSWKKTISYHPSCCCLTTASRLGLRRSSSNCSLLVGNWILRYNLMSNLEMTPSQDAIVTTRMTLKDN